MKSEKVKLVFCNQHNLTKKINNKEVFLCISFATIVNSDSEGCSVSSTPYLNIRIPKSVLSTQNLTGYKSWLSEQYAAGTPVCVSYELVTPVTENIVFPNIITQPLYTRIYCDDKVKPTSITINVKVKD